MKKLKTALTFVATVSGCSVNVVSPIAIDRAGYSDAWYYERLTPYVENTVFFENEFAPTSSVYLRAVSELVGVPLTFPDGSVGHADVWRPDIEIFFATPVTEKEDRIKLIQATMRETCPLTDLKEIQEKVEYANQTYVVLQDVPCGE